MSCSFESLEGMQVPSFNSVNTRPPDLYFSGYEFSQRFRPIKAAIICFFKGEIDAKEETSLQVMDKFCKYIYAKDVTDRLRTQVILRQEEDECEISA